MSLEYLEGFMRRRERGGPSGMAVRKACQPQKVEQRKEL
jgi:hypothetical protein